MEILALGSHAAPDKEDQPCASNGPLSYCRS
jgi:hypothetical protein